MKRFLSVLVFALLALAAQAALHPQYFSEQAARSNPFDLVGQLLFTSGSDDYVGSGTVVRPSSILTAGHNIYDPTTGWSTEVEFRRSNYGTSALTDVFASHLYLLARYQAQANAYGTDSIRTFAFDSAGVVFASSLAGGRVVRLATSAGLLSNSYFRVAVGYGAEGSHDGNYPLGVSPRTPFYDTCGEFYENDSIYIEGGMSGGPLLSYYSPSSSYFLTGVVVSGSTDPETGGIRHVDTGVVNFCATYLK